ncbi:MAG: 30S ribosomal protein S19e [Candidatus Heimdallarchaeota archaeon]|nr:30S ribosomal protein S19e [Candidatus Heimdallarchaeota archaeon]
MTTAYDVSVIKLIDVMTKELKAMPEIVPPPWAPFVKTGVDKELPPENPDWWYVRASAVLRKIYVKGPLGTRRLKSYYGGKKNRGAKQEKARSGSGNIIRKILQQLEKARLVVTVPAGRQITAKGMSFVDEASRQAN